jgi:hypothetical protein
VRVRVEGVVQGVGFRSMAGFTMCDACPTGGDRRYDEVGMKRPSDGWISTQP